MVISGLLFNSLLLPVVQAEEQVLGSQNIATIQTEAITESGSLSQSGIDNADVSDMGSTDEEEQDNDDISLSDDKAEIDSQKDFTAVVRQSLDYTCGPAALATLMTQLGNEMSEEEVLSYIQNLSPEK